MARQATPAGADGSATAKAIDYSLKRWWMLMRYIDDGDLLGNNIWEKTASGQSP